MGHTDGLPRGIAHPDVPDLRRRVVAGLHREIGGLLRPSGHARAGRLWVRRTLFVAGYVEVQRGRYGFGRFINVGCEARLSGWGGPLPSHREGTWWRIGRFTGNAREADRLDMLPHIDLEPDSPLRRDIEGLLRERVLPFLRCCHTPCRRAVGPPAPMR